MRQREVRFTAEEVLGVSQDLEPLRGGLMRLAQAVEAHRPRLERGAMPEDERDAARLVAELEAVVFLFDSVAVRAGYRPQCALPQGFVVN